MASPCDSGLFPVETAVSMKTLSPQTTGVAEPVPGTLIFHLMFFSSLHSVGGWPVGETPLHSGPRHCGQFWAVSAAKILVPESSRPQRIVSSHFGVPAYIPFRSITFSPTPPGP